MATRKAITKSLAVRHRDGSKELKGEMLGFACGVTGCEPCDLGART